MEVPGAEQSRRIGPYTLLGSGRTVGGGEIFAARTDEGLLVTVTVAGPKPAANPEFRDRLRAAVEAARRRSGTFLVPVVDADADAPVPWVATRFTAGLPLRRAVDRHGALGEPALRVLADGLARALAVLHGSGTVHGGVDPDAVLLTMDGPRIGALGLVGATASPPPSPTDDMFDLGSTVLYAASGGEQDTDALPASLREVIGGCLYPEPSDRPTAEQLVDYLEHQALPAPEGGWLPPAVTADMAAEAAAVGSAAGDGVQGPAPTPSSRASGPGVSRRNVLLGMAGGAALLGGGAVALAFSSDPSPASGGPARGPGATARPAPPSGVRTSPVPSISPSSTDGPASVVLAGPGPAQTWSRTEKRAPTCLEASDKVLMVVTDTATSFLNAGNGDAVAKPLKTTNDFGAGMNRHPTAYADGVFYLLCDAPGEWGLLAAFDAAGGKAKWAVRLAASDPGGGRLLSNYSSTYVAVAGSTLFVCGQVRKPGHKFSVEKPTTGYIRAFNAADGKRLWQVEGTDINNVLVPSSGSRLLAASAIPAKQPGRVQMIDAARKGARGWMVPLRYPSSYFTTGWPLTGYADGHFLFAGGKGDTLSVVDAATGTEKWHQRFEAKNGDRVSMGAPFSSLDGATVYVPIGSDLVALATADGTPRWVATVDGASDTGGANLFTASLGLGGRHAQCSADTVFATDSAKTLWAIDAATGRARWKYSDPSQPDVGFRWTVGGDRVFIASHLTVTAIAADGR